MCETPSSAQWSQPDPETRLAAPDGFRARLVDRIDKTCQYLAFIHAYTQLNGRPPAEADFSASFASRRLRSTK
jgi:hypothetical protein